MKYDGEFASREDWRPQILVDFFGACPCLQFTVVELFVWEFKYSWMAPIVVQQFYNARSHKVRQ